jgi:uncharacterized coiled-coil DUF342 family protein
VENFQRQYNEWNEARQVGVTTFEERFHGQLDNAFEQLQKMTSEILRCTDEELNAITLDPQASSVVALIQATRQAFHSLREAASLSLEQLCTQSQQVFAEETGLFQLRDDLKTQLDKMVSELGSVASTQAAFYGEFENAQRDFEGLERKIREYDEMVRPKFKRVSLVRSLQFSHGLSLSGFLHPVGHAECS